MSNPGRSKIREGVLLLTVGLCAALLAGTALSRGVLGPSLYSPRTSTWTMVLAFLLTPLPAACYLRRAPHGGAIGAAMAGASIGALAGAGLGLFAALHLAGENQDLLETLVPLPLAWLAVLGSSMAGCVWGLLLGLPTGAFLLGLARAILDEPIISTPAAAGGGAGKERVR